MYLERDQLSRAEQQSAGEIAPESNAMLSERTREQGSTSIVDRGIDLGYLKTDVLCTVGHGLHPAAELGAASTCARHRNEHS